MSYLGLDPAAVRQLAQQMNNAASEIQTLSGQLTAQLQGAPWTGPDRENFVNEWQSTHLNQLHVVIQALQNAANTANRNAQEQEQVSAS